MVEEIAAKDHLAEVNEYIGRIANKSDLERTDLAKEKTGVFTGSYAINPVNKNKVPIWIADYVLSNYGTGAVMAVPAHDQRDFEFALKYNLEIIQVIKSGDQNIKEHAFEGYGELINSREFSGLKSEEGKNKITNYLKENGYGNFTTNYKLRDWVFSRQRYWGEPIPIVHCDNCGSVAVPESELPVKLPKLEKFEPTGTGESPLALATDWVNTKCPKCGGQGKRETNTMPQWAGSCWYYLRYIDPNNSNEAWDKTKEKYYMPVDLYIGGAEHAVLHLLYARFWHKFLFDQKLVSTDEPFQKLQNVGLILGPDRQKMSKSRGNVINPTDLQKKYGIDALRLYEMFIGPFDQPAFWTINGISGTRKFLDKVINCFEKRTDSEKGINQEILDRLFNTVTRKIEKLQFNTAVSDFMSFSNSVDLKSLSEKQWQDFLIILSPFAPHTCEYLWQNMGLEGSIFASQWPEAKEVNLKSVSYVVQINAKKRALIEVSSELNEQKTLEFVKNNELVKYRISDKKIKKTIFIKGKLINFLI
jgi:leucyl-tRNA synthetase